MGSTGGATYQGTSRRTGGGTSLYYGNTTIGRNLTPAEESTLRAAARERGVELSNERRRRRRR